MRRSITSMALSIAFVSAAEACKKTPSNTTTGTQSTSAAASGGVVSGPMTLAFDHAAGGGFCIPASLAADGSVTVEERVAARFSGNRLVTTAGAEVLRVEANQIVVPWNANKSLRIEADGTFSDDRGWRYDVGANGVVSMHGENGRCRISDYRVEQRRSALLLFIAPMMLMAHEMHVRNNGPNAVVDSVADAGAAPMQPQIAQVRVIHAIATPNAAHVTFKWNDIETPAWDDIAYASRTGFYASQTGSRLYTISPVGNAADSSRIVYGSTPALEAGKEYTAVLTNPVIGGQPTAQLLVEADPAVPAASEGNAVLSFFNAIGASSRVDLCAPPAAGSTDPTVVFESASEGSWGRPIGDDRYATVPVAALARLQIRVHADRACTGAMIGGFALEDFASQHQYTLVAVGQRSGRPSAQLLACPADDSTCRTIALNARAR